MHASDIADSVSSRTSAKPVVIGDPCYGACDIRKDDAEALVHFGHSRIPSQDDGGNVLYIEARAEISFDDLVIPADIPKKVGLLATIQYVHLIPELIEILERTGRTCVVGKGNDRIEYPGQVLGCNCSAASIDVDSFIFIGEGDFHPLAAAFGTERTVTVLNPITKEFRNIDETKDRILRKRFAAIQSAKDAERFLIIKCSKSGQRRDDVAETCMEMICDAGKKGFMTVMDEIGPERLMSYDVDAYVNTACPRIAMDDSSKYRKPMLTPPELEIVLGRREWDDYVFDQIG